MSASKSYQFPIPDFLIFPVAMRFLGLPKLTILPDLLYFAVVIFLLFLLPNLIGFNPAFLLPLLMARFVLSDIFAIGNQGVGIIKNDGFSQKKLNHKS